MDLLRRSASTSSILLLRAAVCTCVGDRGGRASDAGRREIATCTATGTNWLFRSGLNVTSWTPYSWGRGQNLSARFYATSSSHHHTSRRHDRSKDLYAVMGVTPSATQQQIKEAYYRLSMKLHPDRNGGSELAHQKFTELTDAYSILGKYTTRRKYDREVLHMYRPKPKPHPHQGTHGSRMARRTHGDPNIMFNFDEFYRMHYGEALKRERRLRKMRERRAAEDKDETRFSALSQRYMLVWTFAAVLVVSLWAASRIDSKKTKFPNA